MYIEQICFVVLRELLLAVQVFLLEKRPNFASYANYAQRNARIMA